MDKESIINFFRDPPELETDRLLFRKLSRDDTRDMYEYSKDPKVTEYLLWNPHESPRYTHKYLSYIQTQYKNGCFFDWGLVYKPDIKMIGTCGFTKIDFENNSAEIGYVLNRGYWNMGLATEAAERIVSLGFLFFEFNRIEAKYFLGNTYSRKVMEDVGMTFEGIHRQAMFVKGEYLSVGVCAMLREDYLKRNERRPL